MTARTHYQPDQITDAADCLAAIHKTLDLAADHAAAQGWRIDWTEAPDIRLAPNRSSEGEQRVTVTVTPTYVRDLGPVRTEYAISVRGRAPRDDDETFTELDAATAAVWAEGGETVHQRRISDWQEVES